MNPKAKLLTSGLLPERGFYRVKRKVFVLCVPFIMLTSSCGSTHFMLLNTQVDVNKHFDIHKMVSGCCGCYTFYVNMLEGGTLKEQFVMGMNCMEVPTKYQFKTIAKGELRIVNSFIAVTDGNHETPLNDYEKLMFQKLDSVYRNDSSYPGDSAFVFSEITGYLKSEVGEGHFAMFENKKQSSKVNQWKE